MARSGRYLPSPDTLPILRAVRLCLAAASFRPLSAWADTTEAHCRVVCLETRCLCVELPVLQPLQLQVRFARVPWQNHWYVFPACPCAHTRVLHCT
jgi:hypothetical protein